MRNSSKMPMKAVPRLFVLFGICLAGLGVWTLWGQRNSVEQATDDPKNSEISDQPVRSPHPEDDSTRFLGSEACRECHSSLFDSYMKHPMARSTGVASGFPPGSEDASRTVHGKQREYHVQEKEGRVVHADIMFDKDGKRIYEQAHAMDFAIGSGQRAFAYLRQEGDLLFQSPLNWYTEQREWDLAPGYRIDDERRFRRRVSDDCLSCHAGRVAAEGEMPNRYRETVFHEMIIGCERCHGPGQDHVTYHREAKQADSAHHSATEKLRLSDPIINPARLSVSQRESVCNQCHLAGAARIVRYGQSEFSFRPGMTVSEVWTILDAGGGVDENGATLAVNHVQQMQSSRCYEGSEKALGCISCHDPHAIPEATHRDEFYKNRCMTCHQSESCTAAESDRVRHGDSCIQCHMPRRDSSNIAHVSQTDHRILRTPDAAPMIADPKATVEMRFFDPTDQQLPKWEQSRAMGVGLWSFLQKKGHRAPVQLGQLLDQALQVHPDDGLALSALGALASQHQRIEQAKAAFQKALADPISREASLLGLLDIAYQSAQWSDALALVDESLSLDPGHPGLHAIRADVLFNLQRYEDATAEARRSIELDPSRIEVCEWLVSVYERMGQENNAASLKETIARMRTARAREQRP